MLPPLHFCQQCLDLPEDLHPSLRGRQLPFQFSNAGITWVSHGSTVGGKRTTASERTAPLPLPLPPDRKPSDSPVIHTACVDVNLADRQAACNPPWSTPAHPPQGSARLTASSRTGGTRGGSFDCCGLPIAPIFSFPAGAHLGQKRLNNMNRLGHCQNSQK